MDDGLVDSADPGWFHYAFDILTRIFYWVGLRKNIRKTVVMVCKIFRTAGLQADEAYTQCMTGEERIFKERQREWVLLQECGKEL